MIYAFAFDLSANSLSTLKNTGKISSLEINFPALIFSIVIASNFVDISYDNCLAISAAISPIIGSHIVFGEAMTSMKYYRNGLLYGLIPEIGIKYMF